MTIRHIFITLATALSAYSCSTNKTLTNIRTMPISVFESTQTNGSRTTTALQLSLEDNSYNMAYLGTFYLSDNTTLAGAWTLSNDTLMLYPKLRIVANNQTFSCDTIPMQNNYFLKYRVKGNKLHAINGNTADALRLKSIQKRKP